MPAPTQPATPTAEKIIYFLGGLPRSGSTLLCNVLAQNPRFHATQTSGMMDVMFNVRNCWSNLIEHQAKPNDAALKRVLHATMQSYYADVDRPVIIDKCRGWCAYAEMAEAALGHKCKILVPVRDLRDVLASFEKLHRNRSRLASPPGEAQNYFMMQTVEGRCDFWVRGDQPVGLAYNRIKDAMQRGFADRMHFVSFEKLTSQPAETMAAIYKFLNEDPFDHDFNNVAQVTTENDMIYGLGDGLHSIRSKIEPVPSQWQTVLGGFAEKYASENFVNVT